MKDKPDTTPKCIGPCGSIDCAYGCCRGMPWTGSYVSFPGAKQYVGPAIKDMIGVGTDKPATAEQQRPQQNSHPAVWPLVMVDMAQRDNLGRERYGTPLQPHNGRDVLTDIYQELLDAAVYIRAAIYERDGK